MVTVTVRAFVGCVSVGEPLPVGLVCSREICVQTDVKRRKEMQQERRSMAGTTFTVTSSVRLFFLPLPPPSGIAPPPMWSPDLARLARLSPNQGKAHGEVVFAAERGDGSVEVGYSAASSTGTWSAGIFILSLLATMRFSTPTADSLMSSTIVWVRPCSTE